MHSGNAAAKQRLLRDLKVIERQEGGGITACPQDNNIFKW